MQRTLVFVSALSLVAAGVAFTACSGDDNGTTSGADSGLGDTSTPVQDSNVPALDSNVPTQDSDAPPDDANVPPGHDASVDAGTDAKSPIDASDAAIGVDASDAAVPVDASDASSAADANDAATQTDASDGGVTLNVMNYLNWCTVTINNDPPKTGAIVSGSVVAGSTATIVAIARPNLADGGSAFEIGPDPWFGTNENDGGAAPGTDVGTGNAETSTAQVTIGAGPIQCVSVCCEVKGVSDCPAKNPCLP